jgi:hypothetical protein
MNFVLDYVTKINYKSVSVGSVPGAPGGASGQTTAAKLMWSGRRAEPVAQADDAGHLGAMLTAEERAVLLEPVADDADAAILAGRRQRMDRAFEAVEGMGGAVHAHLERLVVVVAAGFTSGHGDLASACRVGV